MRVSESVGVRVCMCARVRVESHSNPSSHPRGLVSYATHTHTHITHARAHALLTHTPIVPCKKDVGRRSWMRQQHGEMKSIISERHCGRKMGEC